MPTAIVETTPTMAAGGDLRGGGGGGEDPNPWYLEED
eukprot:CAMPEP_0202459628 /NCGR_PEP_ID=MMETSP1360-20130828/37169_1 /ASSEMBLY_ACC=CAM_ASM_000848 /TAXON_ID=515479 /ORGANISM="Licmophora paradoxa, Strain CCMP2313" /LENGTH=36 /DNA_ID= /DNA_START= /DNA_END= /DNA_ORIENTATION=